MLLFHLVQALRKVSVLCHCFVHANKRADYASTYSDCSFGVEYGSRHDDAVFRECEGERSRMFQALEPVAICDQFGFFLREVIFYREFEEEFKTFEEELQDELLTYAILLRDYGPILGRPTVDTLKGSRHANMKELRFDREGEIWRVAFAFDPKRRAILLVGGDKAGV